MPLKRCTKNGKSGWKAWKKGYCYTGKDARKKALAQLNAIHVNKDEGDLMKKKLKKYIELHIFANALVPSGAVGEQAVFKEDGSFVMNVPVTKFNDEKMEMYSILYMLDKEDSQGCIIDDPEVLIKARDEFVQGGGLKKVKMLHGGKELGESAFTCEFWIIKSDIKKTGEELNGEMLREDVVLMDPVFPDEKYVGALAASTKFTDVELWNKVKTEKWETSIEGRAKVLELEIEDDEDAEKRTLNIFEKLFKGLFNKFSNESINKTIEEKISKDFLDKLERDKNNLWKYIDMLYGSLLDVIWSDDKDIDVQVEVTKNIDQFKETILKNTDIFVKVEKEKDDMNKEEMITFLKSDEGKTLIKEALGEDVVFKADSEEQIKTVVKKMVEDGEITTKVGEEIVAKITALEESGVTLTTDIDAIKKSFNEDPVNPADPPVKKTSGRKGFQVAGDII